MLPGCELFESTVRFVLFPTLGVGLLDFRVSYHSSPAETASWSAQPHRLPRDSLECAIPTDYRETPWSAQPHRLP